MADEVFLYGFTYSTFELYGEPKPGRGGECRIHAPVQLAVRCVYHGDVEFKNTPGATVVVFYPEQGTRNDRRSSCRRLYGLMGGVS